MEGILDGATIEFENDNPKISEDFEELSETDTVDKILLYQILNFLGINDTNYTDPDIFNKVNKIVKMIGKDKAFDTIQHIANEIGFKPGVLDEIYSFLRIRGYDGNTDSI